MVNSGKNIGPLDLTIILEDEREGKSRSNLENFDTKKQSLVDQLENDSKGVKQMFQNEKSIQMIGL